MVSNPEFLREGTAVHDFLHPDRVVIGSADRAAAERVAELYATHRHADHHHRPGVGRDDQVRGQRVPGDEDQLRQRRRGDVRAVGADVAAVVDGHRLATPGSARQFLRPGPGWGGSCFPKDSRALVKIAEDHGYNFSMMRGVIDVNDEQLERMVDKIADAAGRSGGDLDGVTVGALGLTFKAGTDDLRESPAMAIIAELRNAGRQRSAFDPTTVGELTPHQAHRPRRYRVGRRRTRRRRRRRRDRACSPSGPSSPRSISTARRPRWASGTRSSTPATCSIRCWFVRPGSATTASVVTDALLLDVVR